MWNNFFIQEFVFIFRTLVDWWNIMSKADMEKHAIEVRVEPHLLKMRPVVLKKTPEKAS